MSADSRQSSTRQALLVILCAAVTYLIGIASPPALMDDVDASQAQVSKTMLWSGNWVTGRLGGVIFLDKAPLKYWMTAALYAVFGTHDWVARLPNALAVIALCFTVYRIGCWAGSRDMGFYAGLALSTSIGLFLFTRIVIPDVILTLAITLAVWAFLRAIDEDEAHNLRWSLVSYAAIACSILLKGLVGVVFPLVICFVYLLITRQLFSRAVWKRLHVMPGLAVFSIIAIPWHIGAILQNPPYFDLTLHADPHFGGKFRGFFWFYFINEQLLRFTNSRWPHDYNTVPRLWFWLYQLIWFFPWIFFFPALRRTAIRLTDRTGRLHVMALIWIAVVMIFFTFSTTQEYYSMPIYPALALLIGSAMTASNGWQPKASRIAAVITGLACLAVAFILVKTIGLATPGDISDVLSKNPDVYTLSLGHMTDLTFAAFAYLRTPLALAGIAFLIGTVGLLCYRAERTFLAVAMMLVLFFQAARVALVVFDPYLSSRPFAEALKKLPRGTLVFNGAYYDFSSIVFYTDQRPLMLNGRINNLEYGSYAPDAPHVFIDDTEFQALWDKPGRVYIATDMQKRKKLEAVVGADRLFSVMHAGGKELLTNRPLRTSPENAQL